MFRTRMKLAAYTLIEVASLSKGTVGRRLPLPFAQGFACGPAGLSDSSLDLSLCSPWMPSTFSSGSRLSTTVLLSLGHGSNKRILQLRAFRDVPVKSVLGLFRDHRRLIRTRGCQSVKTSTLFGGPDSPLFAQTISVGIKCPARMYSLFTFLNPSS